MDTPGPSNESLSNPKRVLVILPSSHIQSILEKYNTQRKFEFHWLTDPNAPDLFGSNIAATKTPMKFNALSFVSRAIEYVQNHKIESMIFFHELTALLAAIICARTGLRGPSV